MAEVRLHQCCLAYSRLWVTSPALRDKESNKSRRPCPGSHRPGLQTSVYLLASQHYFPSGRKQKSSRKQQKLQSTKNKSMQKASDRIVPLYICHSRKTANACSSRTISCRSSRLFLEHARILILPEFQPSFSINISKCKVCTNYIQNPCPLSLTSEYIS